MMGLEPAAWMLETTLRDIRGISKTFVDPSDRSRLEGIVGQLQPPDARTGVAND
jgi:hypothetical protein